MAPMDGASYLLDCCAFPSNAFLTILGALRTLLEVLPATRGLFALPSKPHAALFRCMWVLSMFLCNLIYFACRAGPRDPQTCWFYTDPTGISGTLEMKGPQANHRHVMTAIRLKHPRCTAGHQAHSSRKQIWGPVDTPHCPAPHTPSRLPMLCWTATEIEHVNKDPSVQNACRYTEHQKPRAEIRN